LRGDGDAESALGIRRGEEMSEGGRKRNREKERSEGRE
jgi:hypothetical protein